VCNCMNAASVYLLDPSEKHLAAVKADLGVVG
jgi:hypothetical protein